MGDQIKEQSKLNYENLLHGFRVFLLAALSVIIFYPPYLQGLFFEKHVLPTAIFVFSVFILFCIYQWLKKDKIVLKTPMDYAAVGFIIVYVLSIFVAVHTRSAIIELLKYCMYFAVFYMVSEFSDSLKTKFLVLWTIVLSAAGVSIIGLDSAIGGNLVGMLNKVFNTFGVQGDMFFGLFVWNRINSTLQYANAMASYAMAVFFVAVGLQLASNKLWTKLASGVLAYILFLTFMLTQSRGAQILLPIVFIFYLLISPKGKRIITAVHVLLLAIPAAIVSFLVTPYLSEAAFSGKALGVMIAGLILSAVLSMAVKYISDILQKINWKGYVAVAVVVLVVLSVGVSYMMRADVPLELSHQSGEANGSKQVSRDVALTPGKEYLLTYEAKTDMQEEKPYIYSVRITSKNRQNILFGGSTSVEYQTFKDITDNGQASVKFVIPDDSNLVSITFLNYYTGTQVTLDNAKIVDPNSGDTVEKVLLKNKYNLETVITRLNNIRYDRNGLTRLVYYLDGFKIFKDQWLLGGGGGAWEYLYRQYQSFNYPSTQAHNYPLQLGIETGIFGILILLLLVVSLLYVYKLYYKKHNAMSNSKDIDVQDGMPNRLLIASVAASIAALFMHSIIDFDFSEAAILLLFWQLIAIFSGEVKRTMTFAEMVPFNRKKAATANKYARLDRNGTNTGTAVCIVLTVVVLIFASKFLKASMHAQNGFDALQENKIEEAINSMNKAIDTDKHNEQYVMGYTPVTSRPDIKTGLADLLLMKNTSLQTREQSGEQITQTELSLFQKQFGGLNTHIQRIESKAKNNLTLTSNLANFYFNLGQADKGLEYLNKGTSLFPLEPSIWHSKVSINYQIMKQYFNNEEYPIAEKYLLNALGVVEEASTANQRNMNPFVLNQETIGLLQTMQYMKDNWDDIGALMDVNEIVHYTIPYMDVNGDGVPDQWKSSDTDLVGMRIVDGGIRIDTDGGGYIYTQNPLKLEMGERYSVEVKVDGSVGDLAFEVVGLIKKAAFVGQEGGWYRAEFLVENEPSKNGNQLRVYVETGCLVEGVVVKEE